MEPLAACDGAAAPGSVHDSLGSVCRGPFTLNMTVSTEAEPAPVARNGMSIPASPLGAGLRHASDHASRDQSPDQDPRPGGGGSLWDGSAGYWNNSAEERVADVESVPPTTISFPECSSTARESLRLVAMGAVGLQALVTGS